MLLALKGEEGPASLKLPVASGRAKRWILPKSLQGEPALLTP